MTTQGSYVPSHPDLFVVEFLPGNFASRLVSLKVGFLRRGYRVGPYSVRNPSHSMPRRESQTYPTSRGPAIWRTTRFNADPVLRISWWRILISIMVNVLAGATVWRMALTSSHSEPLLRPQRGLRFLFRSPVPVASASFETDQGRRPL